MTKPNKEMRVVKRFVLAMLETHANVVGDIAGVYAVFNGESYCGDLMKFQITRKLNAIGLRDSLITFLIEDEGFRNLLGW